MADILENERRETERKRKQKRETERNRQQKRDQERLSVAQMENRG